MGRGFFTSYRGGNTKFEFPKELNELEEQYLQAGAFMDQATVLEKMSKDLATALNEKTPGEIVDLISKTLESLEENTEPYLREMQEELERGIKDFENKAKGKKFTSPEPIIRDAEGKIFGSVEVDERSAVSKTSFQDAFKKVADQLSENAPAMAVLKEGLKSYASLISELGKSTYLLGRVTNFEESLEGQVMAPDIEEKQKNLQARLKKLTGSDAGILQTYLNESQEMLKDDKDPFRFKNSQMLLTVLEKREALKDERNALAKKGGNVEALDERLAKSLERLQDKEDDIRLKHALKAVEGTQRVPNRPKP